MTVETAVMLDTIGMDAGNIPKTTRYVGAYVSGTGSVPWSGSSLKLFPDSRIIRIAQDAAVLSFPAEYDELDVENGTMTPTQAASAIRARVESGFQWTTVYATSNVLAKVAEAVRALGDDVWNGHVDCILANWDLDEAEAAALIGTRVQGMTCRGVQWASPSSNPDTLCPGSDKTLKQLNVDISVVDASWVPSVRTVATTAPVATVTSSGIVVYGGGDGPLTSRSVTSTDGTKTWQ